MYVRLIMCECKVKLRMSDGGVDCGGGIGAEHNHATSYLDYLLSQ